MIFQVWVHFSRVKAVPTLAVDIILCAIDSESRTWRKVGMFFMRLLRYINTGSVQIVLQRLFVSLPRRHYDKSRRSCVSPAFF